MAHFFGRGYPVKSFMQNRVRVLMTSGTRRVYMRFNASQTSARVSSQSAAPASGPAPPRVISAMSSAMSRSFVTAARTLTSSLSEDPRLHPPGGIAARAASTSHDRLLVNSAAPAAATGFGVSREVRRDLRDLGMRSKEATAPVTGAGGGGGGGRSAAGGGGGSASIAGVMVDLLVA